MRQVDVKEFVADCVALVEWVRSTGDQIVVVRDGKAVVEIRPVPLAAKSGAEGTRRRKASQAKEG